MKRGFGACEFSHVIYPPHLTLDTTEAVINTFTSSIPHGGPSSVCHDDNDKK